MVGPMVIQVQIVVQATLVAEMAVVMEAEANNYG
jgi:hypothetical protein